MGIFKLNGIDYMGGGGGGNTNYEELTQLEYDALTEEEKTNGTVYFITDADEISTSKFQPVIYSKDEREIGVYIDGKPLYQKTLLYENITRGRVNNLPHNISNIETVVNVNWAFISTLHNNQTVVGQETTDYNYWANIFIVNSTGISYRFGNSWGDHNLLITIQYTKTTDQPGSGKWTPQGTPAVHYSTAEHIIGTWIDGSTLYEKTWEFATPLTVSQNSWTTTTIDKTGIGMIIECIAVNQVGTSWGTISAAIAESGDYVKLLTFRNGDNIAVKWITLRYLKTS